VAESTPGVTPSTGDCKELRLTGESLNFNIQTDTSKELRADRQTTDLVPVGASCEGGFNFELSFKEYDALLEAVLQGDWSGDRLSNGVHQRFFTFEKEMSDVGQFLAYRGMSPSKLSLSFETGSIVTGSFEFLGYAADDMSTSSALPGTPIPSETYDIMNSVVGVGSLSEGGMPMGDTFIQSLTLDLDNALRGQSAIGYLGFVGVASGTVSVTGTMQVYLKDSRAYDKFINNSASSLSWNVTDGAGNGYKFTLPKIKYSGGKIVAGAINQDVMVEMPWQAIMDGTSRKTIFIDRI
jgi:hypothetical protein